MIKRIGIIGAGFSGLSAAYYLSQKGYKVSVLELMDQPGGLAIGFKDRNWNWTLEEHYHHLFTSDTSIARLAKEVGVNIIYTRPKTSTLIGDKIYQLDSPISLLLFHKLPIYDRIKTGLVIAYLKLNPFWKSFEKVTAYEFIVKYMGKKSWEILWKPLFVKKFGKYYSKVSAAWFWGRICKRSASLGYPNGGFLRLAETIMEKSKKLGVSYYFKTKVIGVQSLDGKYIVKTNRGNFEFDVLVSTLPTKMLKSLIKIDNITSPGVSGLGAVNLVLSLKNTFLSDGTYWLNVNNMDTPFVSVVEHTNFMESKNYANQHLLYVGNYLETTHKYFKYLAGELLNEYYSYLQKINLEFDKSWINRTYLFKAQFAQPLFPLNYSILIPPYKVSNGQLYICNMEQVYPWDRGTNYAVELGKKVAGMIVKQKI